MSLSFLLHALAGTLANVLSISIVFPFDTARTLLQVQDRRKAELSLIVIRDLIRAEGWWRLYVGWRSLVLSLSITNFIYFYVFYGLKSFTETPAIIMDLLFGVIAGCLAVLVSNPFWVVNTRLKLQDVRLSSSIAGRKRCCFDGIVDCFVKIYELEGIGAFFGGLAFSLILVSNPVINFAAYEFLKRFFLSRLNAFFSYSLLYFLFGGLAKFFATVTTYPLQVVQTRSRAGLSVLSQEQKGKGSWYSVLSLFRGLESKLVQTVLTSAIMFFAYEHVRTLLLVIIDLFTNL